MYECAGNPQAEKPDLLLELGNVAAGGSGHRTNTRGMNVEGGWSEGDVWEAHGWPQTWKKKNRISNKVSSVEERGGAPMPPGSDEVELWSQAPRTA